MKRIVCMVLSALFALSLGLGLAGCGGSSSPLPNGSDPTTEPPSDDTPDTSTDPDDPYSGYSQILQNVLKKTYYQNLSAEYKQLQNSDANRFCPHPYGLFEDLGIDVQSIKADNLECFTTTYIKNGDTNTLYVTTRVEGVGSTPYYKCITASYSLTDREYDDLYAMHSSYYLQGALFIQELSYAKEATIIYNANIAKDSYETFSQSARKSIDLKNLFGTYLLEIDFAIFDISAQTFRLIIRTSSHLGQKMIDKKAQLRIANCSITYQEIKTDGDIFLAPDHLYSTDWDALDDSKTDITYFESQHSPYKNVFQVK